jgi:hypothetical protein
LRFSLKTALLRSASIDGEIRILIFFEIAIQDCRLSRRKRSSLKATGSPGTQTRVGWVMRTVYGRIGGSKAGLDVSLAYDETKLTGRVGGTVVGMDVHLEFQGDPMSVLRVSGRVGGAVRGFDVHGQVLPNLVLARLGGVLIGENLRLELDLSAHTVSGRYSTAVAGADAVLGIRGFQVSGQVGDHQVNLTFTTPPQIAVLAAGIAFRVLEDGVHAPDAT